LIGGGNLQAGTDELRSCFANNAEFVYTLPPKYAALSFAVTGPEAFARHVAGLYQANGFVRTQHFVTNLRMERTGGNTAIIRGYLSAIHVFPDERVFFATATYVDTVHRLNGQWKIVRRDEPLTSLTLLPEFPLGP
jgi:SnoaL-like domain